MKDVLITGAAGGMGREAVKLLAGRGYRVFALDRIPSAAEENVCPITADVTDPESVGAAFAAVREQTGRLSAVIHFAGIYLLDSLIEMTPGDFERIFRINLGGAYLVNRTFRPLLGEGSSVIMITSELAVRDPLPFTGIYAITKAALDRYAYSLRMELQLSGINVSVIRAGAVDTGMIPESTRRLDAFCERTALYSPNAARFRRIVDSVEARKVPPAKIAKKLLKILGSRRPRFAYAVNRNPLLIIFDALPARLRFFIIRKILGGGTAE